MAKRRVQELSLFHCSIVKLETVEDEWKKGSGREKGHAPLPGRPANW